MDPPNPSEPSTHETLQRPLQNEEEPPVIAESEIIMASETLDLPSSSEDPSGHETGPVPQSPPQRDEELQDVDAPEDVVASEALDSEAPESGEPADADKNDESTSEADSLLARHVSKVSISELPMPDMSGFSVPFLSEPEVSHEETLPDDAEKISDPLSSLERAYRALAPLPEIIRVSDILKTVDHEGGTTRIDVAHLGHEAGLIGEMQATYLRLPPGTRTSPPVAQRLGDVITYCISGRGLMWQNGWTFPFEATDCVGWKAGTGVAHTIINDSNRDGTPGEDLVLITAHEVREGESFFYPLDRDVRDANSQTEDDTLWRNPPIQDEPGPHPGVPSAPNGSSVTVLPEPQVGYRPSNVINAFAELDAIGEGELFANATSLSQETGLSGRLGCNLEIPPPGTRSSDPHAHSLEDELVYVIGGNGLVWINGNVKKVREGDAVGFPGGTGVAHNFINDSNADGHEGDPLILWIIGQNKRNSGDLIYYPLHAEKKRKSSGWWADCPKHDLGPHNGRPRRPRT